MSDVLMLLSCFVFALTYVGGMAYLIAKSAINRNDK